MRETFGFVGRVLLAIALTLGGVLLGTSGLPGLFGFFAQMFGGVVAVIGFVVGMSVAAGE